MYSLGLVVRNRPMRVALPTHNRRTPVAIGSSVPRCPTLLVLSSFLARCTMSCDVTPPGLSMMRRPSIDCEAILYTTLMRVFLQARFLNVNEKSTGERSPLLDRRGGCAIKKEAAKLP